IARSQTPAVNVSEILQDFGGGGHTQAASAVIRNLSLVDSVESLKKTLALKIPPAKTALDIMTSPVKTIEYNTTLINAEKSMTRSEINVLPVMIDNELYGIISREGVEKALYHGFAQNSVNDFCTTEPHTVSLDTPISTVESMMIENNLRFMPVMEGSVLRGAITRTDLLRSLYETLLRKSRVRSTDSLSEKPSIGKNLFSVIHTRLPVEVCDLLHLCGKVAADLTFRAYLVGGSVRDILRNESNLDIDIVIEGDGIIFAKELGARLKARVRCHKKFGTASIITDILKFDVATARTEYYESPAALPTVEMSSIKKDLYRRDFTINTMAISLDPERFGVLIDFFGGQRDIKEKTLRILHNLSFIEDPTRAFRAIRFAERFGFRICKHTLNLIKAAVKIELFNKLSGTRIYDELNLLFLETEPVEALKRLSELKLLECAFPGIIITKALEELFRSIQESYNWFTLLFLEEQVNKSHLFLMALLEQITQEKRDSALQRLAVPSKAAQEIASGIKNSGQVLARLKNCSDIDIYEILFPLQLPVIIFTMAKAYNSSQKKAISRYLTKLRGTVPEISGNDLQSMGFTPGPVYRQILSAIIDARLQGSINSKEEELNFIKETFKN
nr:CBS domain-containing protein [bacterium]